MQPNTAPRAVAMAASVNNMPTMWPRSAPIALSRPSSRRRSAMIAENSTLTIAAVLTNMMAISTRTPSMRAERPCRIEVSIDSPPITLTPGKFARIAKRACWVVTPGASSTSTPEILSGSSGARAPQIWRMISRMPSIAANDTNNPRSCVPTAVRPRLP